MSISNFQQIFQTLQKYVDQNKLKSLALKEATELAQDAIKNSLCDEENPFEQFPSIKLDPNDEDSLDEYFLILDFLEIGGFKIGSPIFKFESQNPNITYNRDDLAKRLGLDPDDPRPLLIQIIESHMNWLESKKAE